MDSALIVLNIIFSTAQLLSIGWVILNPKIHEGPVIKLGLILMAISQFAYAYLLSSLDVGPNVEPILRAMTVGNAGIAAVVVGMAWRLWRYPHLCFAARAFTGFADLDSMPGEYERAFNSTTVGKERDHT